MPTVKQLPCRSVEKEKQVCTENLQQIEESYKQLTCHRLDFAVVHRYIGQGRYIAAVSYTHLDVYKRQGLARGFNLLFVFCIIVSKSVCDLYCN